MSQKSSPKEFLQLIRELQQDPEAQRETVPVQAMDPLVKRLRIWQSERLTHTYSDLLADGQYGAACRFFLDDLYSPHDFSQRDYDAERLHAILSRFLPAAMLRLLADALQLNHLSNRLDQTLAHALADLPADQAGITPEAYAQAYRVCDNYGERKEQIDLLANILREAGAGARSPVFSVGLRLARTPAYSAGWEELHAFLERGMIACKPIKKIDYFVDTIYSREMLILENIYARRESPFDIVTNLAIDARPNP